MFRFLASLVAIACVALAALSVNSGGSNTTSTQPVGNASPKMEQAPAQKPTNSGGKNFNL